MKNIPAFPSTEFCDTFYGQTRSINVEGMTLRDWFAGQVIVSIVASAYGNLNSSIEQDADRSAKEAYKFADALLTEREKINL